MKNLFNVWKKPEVTPNTGYSEMMSQVVLQTNEIFKIFLNKYSWFVYFMAGLLILCCFCYHTYNFIRRIELRSHRQDMQRASERIPQRRRPGAVCRDHVIETVRQYTKPDEGDGPRNEQSYTLKRTRSGAIYGYYNDRENLTD